MGRKRKHSIIETISEKLNLIPSLHDDKEVETPEPVLVEDDDDEVELVDLD